jgi:hypothetical protein
VVAGVSTQRSPGSSEDFSLTLAEGWQQVDLRGGLSGNHQEEFGRIFRDRPEMQRFFQQYVSYVDVARQMGTVYLAVPISDSSLSIPFETSITITKMPNHNNAVLADLEDGAVRSYAPWLEAGFMRSFTNLRVLLPGGEALVQSFLYQTQPGDPASPLCGCDTYHMIHNGYLYTVTAVVPAADFTRMKNQLAQMMQSFYFSD